MATDDHIRIDNDHFSNSFLDGDRIHQDPLVQKITDLDTGRIAWIETPVSPTGDIGTPDFRFPK